MKQYELNCFRFRLESMAADLRSRHHEIHIEKVAEAQEQSAIYSRNEQSALQIEHDRRQLASVLDALRRIADGTYAVCLRCEASIKPARLQAKPEACYCISCQEVIEAEERLESEMVAYREVE